jgi:hypothetical protein
VSKVLLDQIFEEQDRAIQWVNLLDYALAELKHIAEAPDHQTAKAIATEASEQILTVTSKMFK